MTRAAATLSKAEINALRRVGHGLANFLPSVHRERLASLGLVTTITAGQRLVLTQVGKERLAEAEAGGRSPSP